jgi:hypothetical protein
VWARFNGYPRMTPANAQIGEERSLGLSSVDSPRTSLDAFRYAVLVIFGLASLLYILQIFTPLRLTTDGITYLSFADAAARGNGLTTIRGTSFVFPKGYPFFLFVMIRTGIFSSATLVASNLVFLGLALLFSFQSLTALGFRREVATIACLLTYMSYATVKFVTQAMSDFLFFFLAACAFWLMTRKSAYRWLAVLPALCAVEVRLVGVALFVPIAFLVWEWAAKRPKLLIPIVSIAACCVGIGIWAGRRYFVRNSTLLHSYGMGHFLWLSGVTHCEDFGQLIFNVPWSKLPAGTAVLIIGTGAIAILLFVMGVIAMFRSAPLISCYLAGCSLLILPWPYTDPRFWLPVMPYAVVAIWKGITQIFERVPRWTLVAYTVLFSIAGFAALGYSTWITFSGANFPYRYGDGELQSVYLAHCPASTASGNNKDALNLLRRYEWHCDAIQ